MMNICEINVIIIMCKNNLYLLVLFIDTVEKLLKELVTLLTTYFRLDKYRVLNNNSHYELLFIIFL